MSSTLQEFLVDLASDPDTVQRFKSDPDGEMSRAGLTAEEAAAVRAGDADSIRKALGIDSSDHMTQFLFSAMVKDALETLDTLGKTLAELEETALTLEEQQTSAQARQLVALRTASARRKVRVAAAKKTAAKQKAARRKTARTTRRGR